MKNKIFTLAALFAVSFYSTSQTVNQRNTIKQSYDISSLNELQNQFRLENIAKKNLVEKYAKLNNWPITIKKDNGRIHYQAIDVTENGQPIYRTLFNRDAANSTRTNYLHTGGGLNLDLNGDDMLIGVWDGEIARTTHNEFTDGPFSSVSRVINKEGSGAINGDHATHVTGTLVAQGNNINAKGMAPEATCYTYDWDNDISEVAQEASNGMLISNHSYGIPVFDRDGNMILPISYPGKYDSQARSWDILHYQAKYYLMVVSAGNEGGLSYIGSTATNRDKLTGEKNSKNNLVVANANDAQISASGEFISVSINSSSSQGPSDDGRIKPDITGNGTVVLSTSNTAVNAYADKTGTSMSSPNVAGSLLLLQEYYNDLNSSFMKSATLKGLACHTADDGGKPGPDEVFGWGLLNMKKAAETLTNEGNSTVVSELTLTQGSTYTLNVKSSGLEDLKASITWTDVAGTAQSTNSNANDPTPALVNDLDIRITKGTTEYLPWKLNLFNISGNAIKGDNSVDNVERVDIENPGVQEDYTITVTHKGSLTSGSQEYSLVVTGLYDILSVEEVITEKNINVWPNPTSNLLNVDLLNTTNGEVTLKLIDITGRVVKEIQAQNKTNQIQVDSLSSGMYLLEVTQGRNSFSKKIIIE